MDMMIQDAITAAETLAILEAARTLRDGLVVMHPAHVGDAAKALIQAVDAGEGVTRCMRCFSVVERCQCGG